VQSVVTYGEQVELRGRLTFEGLPEVPPVVVSISARAAGETGFTPLGVAPVGADGSFVFAHTPERSTVYRAEFAGDEGQGLLPAEPAEVLVQVRFAVALSAPPIMWFGETAKLTGTVAPALPEGTLVSVRLLEGTAWTTVQTVPLDAQSAFSLDWVTSAAATLRFRAVVPASENYAAGISGEVVSQARDPDPHHVPVTLRRCIVIDHSEFRVYYYEYGHIVRDFPSVLGKPSTPTPLNRFRIYKKIPAPLGPQRGVLHEVLGHHRHPRHQCATAPEPLPPRLLPRLHATAQQGHHLAVLQVPDRHARLERALGEPAARCRQRPSRAR